VLSEGRQKCLVHGIPYVSFDEWRQIRGKNMSEMVGDVGTEYEFLDLQGKALSRMGLLLVRTYSCLQEK
jgi:hypothetical protein